MMGIRGKGGLHAFNVDVPVYVTANGCTRAWLEMMDMACIWLAGWKYLALMWPKRSKNCVSDGGGSAWDQSHQQTFEINKAYDVLQKYFVTAWLPFLLFCFFRVRLVRCLGFRRNAIFKWMKKKKITVVVVIIRIKCLEYSNLWYCSTMKAKFEHWSDVET